MIRVGDKVEILQDGADNSCVEVGSVGVVILLDIDDEYNMYNVQFSSGLTQYFYADQMSLVKEN